MRDAPIRETLAGGLRARMNECGYRVTTATTLQEAGDVASRLKNGDVAVWLGIHQERNFMRLAPRLAAKGVYVISYQTDYFPLKAYPGAAETWYSVWKSNFTASNGSLVDFHTGGPTRTRRTTPNAPRGCRGASSRPATCSRRSRRRRSRPRQPPRSRSSARGEVAGTSAARGSLWAAPRRTARCP